VSRFEELLEDFFYRKDEPVGDLFEPGSQEDLPAGPALEEAPAEFLAFALGPETYALPIERLREIVKVPPLTEVPRGPAELLGVMNLRGEVLPVYDLKLRLQLSSAPAQVAGPHADLGQLPRGARVLVLSDERGDAGVLVDRVQEVLKLRPSMVEPAPRGVAAADRSSIAGIGRRGDELFILLDLGQALP
jgi:purine-binding chemotaxis protein CheW